MQQRHSRTTPPLSDTDRLPFDMGPEFGAQGLVGDKIDGAPQQVFDIELCAEVSLCRRRPVEPDQKVDIAVRARFVAREGAEEAELDDPEALRERRLAVLQRGEDFVSGHGPLLPLNSRERVCEEIARLSS